MSSFIPNYYNNYYFRDYFNPFQQRDGYRYDKEYFRPRPLHPSYYAPQSRYQTTFFANNAFSTTAFNQYGMNRPALGYPHHYDDRYRPQYTWPRVNKAHNRGWAQGDSALPLSSYSKPYSNGDNDGPIYQYEKEVRYIPYPVFVGPGAAGVSTGRNLGYQNMAGSQFPASANTTYPQYSNASQLPPKIRVIFIPPSTTSPQQPCIGSLAMPPFSFNRMTQPLCSFPLPPPLPQISSLPLTPALQQRVMQQYANPVAVLPFGGGWPSSQPSMPMCAPVLSQPSIMSMPSPSQLPLMPIPSFPQPFSMPQPSFPQPSPMLQPSLPQPFSMPQPAFPQSSFPQPSFPQPSPMLQPYLPQPFSMPQPSFPQPFPVSQPSFPQLSPMPQLAVMPVPPSPQLPMVPTLPQATPQYAPYPSTGAPALPYNMPTPLANAYPSSSYTNPAPFTSQAPANDYPSMCRACVPAPPALSVAVTGYCWIQHCSACHHVPANASTPNTRPAHGRTTPLLRQPTAVPNVSDARSSQQQYPYVNAYRVSTSGWNQLPPLPPGAVIISDEYIDKHSSNGTHHYSQRQSVQQPRVNNSVPRVFTLSTYSTQKNIGGKQDGQNRQQNVSHADRRPLNRSVVYTNTSSPPSQAPNRHYSSSSSSSSVLNSPSNANNGQSDQNAAAKQPNGAEKELPPMARMINLHYRHRTPDIQAIYQSNEQSRSSDSDRSAPEIYRSGSSLFLRKRKSHSIQPSSVSLASPKAKEKSARNRSSATIPSKQTKQRILPAHHLQDMSSVTNSINSLNMASETTNKDQDAVSMASTTKNDYIDETKAAS